ncbi:MAG: cation:proton antiporter [Candidatus Iainarchaeum archaeon]|uniref:Cation:proton antiporter n=1 Tax=Candidatus Iainarchaeum sp. TaxID=3101447 RepID=A0A497JIY1_9ARCH|nr:MAG: cation:proton antiporter [Candidatus Diapherotrites archaeon]
MSVFIVAAVLLFLTILISIVRLVLGPSIADRVISVDTANTVAISALIVLAAAYKQAMFIDIAIVYAMLSFGGTIYFAHYLGAKK